MSSIPKTRGTVPRTEPHPTKVTAPVVFIRNLRRWAQATAAPAFVRQVGPFVLIQRPPQPMLVQLAQAMGGARTVGMAHRTRLAEEIVTMMLGFDHLVVTTMPKDQLSVEVGRTPQCGLVVDEPSVSKRHAVLRWDLVTQSAFVEDLHSTNGTFLNASQINPGQAPVMDGDSLSFGDAQFIFFLADTLYAHLSSASR